MGIIHSLNTPLLAPPTQVQSHKMCAGILYISTSVLCSITAREQRPYRTRRRMPNKCQKKVLRWRCLLFQRNKRRRTGGTWYNMVYSRILKHAARDWIENWKMKAESIISIWISCFLFIFFLFRSKCTCGTHGIRSIHRNYYLWIIDVDIISWIFNYSGKTAPTDI